MADPDDAAMDYLEFAYDEVDGSPQRSFQRRDVEDRLGLSDDAKRDVRRDLVNRGLIAGEGTEAFRLRLPAIHHVEEARLEGGRREEVDARREERGTYVRTLHDLAEGAAGIDVELDDLQEELEMGGEAERRAREYLDAAGLIEEGDEAVRLTPDGEAWAESA
jgi:hypothetical protein